MDLARFAVQMVRRHGGVIEHPAWSRLWPDQGLPQPGQGRDAAGGWTLPILQQWWGHRAEKATWLYIVGAGPRDVPHLPYAMGAAPNTVENMGKAEREHTPVELARWLVELARRTKKPAP